MLNLRRFEKISENILGMIYSQVSDEMPLRNVTCLYLKRKTLKVDR